MSHSLRVTLRNLVAVGQTVLASVNSASQRLGTLSRAPNGGACLTAEKHAAPHVLLSRILSR